MSVNVDSWLALTPRSPTAAASTRSPPGAPVDYVVRRARCLQILPSGALAEPRHLGFMADVGGKDERERQTATERARRHTADFAGDLNTPRRDFAPPSMIVLTFDFSDEGKLSNVIGIGLIQARQSDGIFRIGLEPSVSTSASSLRANPYM